MSLSAANTLGGTVIRRGTGGRSSTSGVVATVFGATGFLGRYIANNLGKVGSHMTFPYRGDEHDYRHLRVTADVGATKFMPFQLLDPETVVPTVQHSNVVINLIGKHFDTRHFAVEDVNIRGAEIIAEACQKAGVKQLIHVSALGADVNSPCRYLRSKGEGEKVVREKFPDATIVRPSDIFGTEDRFLNRIAQFRNIPLVGYPLVDGGKATKRPVYCGDVAAAIFNMVGNEDALGQTYELVGEKEFTVESLVKYVNDTTRMKHKAAPIPLPLMKLACRMIEMSPLDPPFSQDDAIMATLNDELTGKPTFADLGITPSAIEKTSINFLRRYRPARHHDEALDS